MRIFIVLFLCLVFAPLKGQDGFLQSYDLGEAGMSFHNMLLVEDTLVVCGQIGVESQQQWGLVFLKMDTLGNILDHSIHFDTLGDDYSFESNYKMIKTEDGGYALVGQMFARQFPVLIKLDEQGDLEFVQEYPDNTVFDIRHWNIIETAHGYISLGVKQRMDDFLWDTFIMGTDKAGNKLWETSYGTFGVWDRLEGIQKIDENEFLITGATYLSSGQVDLEDLWSIPKAIKIDTTGQILWEWEGERSYIGESSQALSHLFPTPDGQWMNRGAISTYFPEDDILTFQAQVVKRDTNFEALWTTTFGEPTSNRNRFSTLAETPDGGWVAVGEYVNRPEGDPLGGYQAAMIAKVSADGDSLWSRIDTLFDHTMIASRPTLGGVVVLPSGSIIACGQVRKTFPDPAKSYGMLIKVDRDGCMEPGCNPLTNSTSLAPLLADFRVYPNPVQDQLFVRGEGSFDVQIMDQNGRLLASVEQLREEGAIDITNLSAGTYFLRLQKGDASIVKKLLKL